MQDATRTRNAAAIAFVDIELAVNSFTRTGATGATVNG